MSDSNGGAALPGGTPPTGEDPHPLDGPQHFSGAASHAVRDELQTLIERDLLGPWDGPHEKFRSRAMGPRERYLVGMLGPRPPAIPTADAAGDVPDGEASAAGGGEADLPDITSPQALGRMWASSMGLSFCVAADVDAVAVRAAWGRYEQREEEDDDGKKTRPWTREPEQYDRTVDLTADGAQRIPLLAASADGPGVHLRVAVRTRDGRRTVEIALLNQQTEPDSNKDTAWIFQPRLTVTARDGAAPVFLPVD
ncbi:helicase, partial [Actinomadura sp. PM05-2]|nr:helicase [Actinomadura parmotrematis]